MRTNDIAGYHLRGLLHGLRALGLDVDQILRDSQFDRAALEDPEIRFAALQVGLLWMHAEQSYRKPTLGIDLATRIPFGRLELVDYLVGACPTLGAGIECLVHHSRLCASGFKYRIDNVTHAGVAGRRLVLDHDLLVAGLPLSMAEYTWGCIVARTRDIIGKGFVPVLTLRRRPEISSAEMMELLGHIPELGAEESMFVPNAQWDMDNPRRDPLLHKLLTAHARDVEARLPRDDFLSLLQGAVVSAMHQGDPSIVRVATRLGLAPRTLQRRLEANGLVFQKVLEELRHELALRYLISSQLSITEVSQLLAYADASAFGRAFRRWTGNSPAAFRQNQRTPTRTLGPEA